MGANTSGIRIEDNVLKGRDAPSTAKYTNIGVALLDTFDNDKDFVGLVDPVTDQKYTFRTMRERSVRTALWMRSQGLQPGDVVAICSDKKLDIGMPCFAALYIGAVFNPLDPEMSKKDFAHLLNVMRPKMAFTNEESAAKVAEAAIDAKLDLKIVVFGRMPGFSEYESIIAEPTEEEVENFRIDWTGSPDETAFIMCSSGTTGLPKGVALRHATILATLGSQVSEKLVGLTSMIFSPIYWLSATWCMLTNVLFKMTNIITPPFEEHSSCAMIEKYKVNFIFLPPNMINRWLKSGALTSYDLSSVKIAVVGGSALATASQEAFIRHLSPGSVFAIGYGTTEAGGTVSVMTQAKNSKPGACGVISDNVQVKVVDPATGEVYGPNKTGEFVVKTPTMMNCYYNSPETTANTLNKEGWLHTGDLGYYNENGEIFYVERLKEILKYRGYHISPVEIETVLLSHPGVKDAIVIGLSHPQDGDLPMAWVVKMSDKSGTGKEVTETELIDLVASELSNAKRLRGGVKFVDSLPKTPSDKVLRKKVREMAESMVNI